MYLRVIQSARRGALLDRFKLLQLPPNSGNELEWLSAIETAVGELRPSGVLKGKQILFFQAV